MPAALSYPNASAGSAATTNNDAAAGGYWDSASNDLSLNGNGNLTLPGGVYYFHDLNTNGNSTLTFTGPATVYVTGSVGVWGTTTTSGNLAKNLSIQVIGNGNVTVGSNGALYANIYAPQSAVTLSGKGAIYGSVLGYSINMTGTSNIYYDLALPGGWNINVTTSGTVLKAQCETRFSKDATGVETFDWIKSGDQYRLLGYHINSNELIER